MKKRAVKYILLYNCELIKTLIANRMKYFPKIADKLPTNHFYLVKIKKYIIFSKKMLTKPLLHDILIIVHYVFHFLISASHLFSGSGFLFILL